MMRSRNTRPASLALVATMVGSLLMVGAPQAGAVEFVICADVSYQNCTTATAASATVGAWTPPFAENPDYGDGEGGGAPPSTPEEAGELPTAVSAVVTPQGRIVYWDGLSGLEQANGPLPVAAGHASDPDRTRLLDLNGATALWLDAGIPEGDNLFCADQRLLADGRVIVAGGTIYQTEPYADIPDEIIDPDEGPDGLAELYGSTNTRFYTDTNESVDDAGVWEYDEDQDMRWRRWYPALVTLADGRVVAMGGVSKLLWNSDLVSDGDPRNSIDILPVNVKEVEVFDPVTERWQDFANPDSEQSLPLYPRVHLLPNGDVLFSGSGQMWGPAGEDINQLGWNNQKIFSVTGDNTAEWSDVNQGPYGARNGAISVMLPLEPPYDTAEFLVSGGTLGTSPGLYLGTTLSEKITVTFDEDGTAQVSSEEAPELNNRRWFSSGVALPNGEVLIFSGSDNDEVVQPSIEAAVRTPELWNGEEWVEMEDGARDRTYHNSALLLPDGSVLVGGHSPINNFYGPEGDNSIYDLGLGIGSNNFRDPSFERFFPPYLFQGGRPFVKTSAAAAGYGTPLPFTTRDDANTEFDESAVHKVVLSRLPAVTHTVDADQRTVVVPHRVIQEKTPSGEAIYHAEIPNNPNVLPPGYYYLFALSEDGVPSVATIVQLGDDVDPNNVGQTEPVDIGMQALRVDTVVEDVATSADASAPEVTRVVTATTKVGPLDRIASEGSGSAIPAGLLIVLGALALGALGLRRAFATQT